MDYTILESDTASACIQPSCGRADAIVFYRAISLKVTEH